MKLSEPVENLFYIRTNFIYFFNNYMAVTTESYQVFKSVVRRIFINMVNMNPSWSMSNFLKVISTSLTNIIISFKSFASKSSKSVFMKMLQFFSSILFSILVITIKGILINFISAFSTEPFYGKFSSTVVRAKTIFNKFSSSFFPIHKYHYITGVLQWQA